MTNILIYAIIACVMYLIFKKPRIDEYEIVRQSDATIEVVCGKFILKEK